MTIKTPQLLTAVGVIAVIAVGLLLAGGADILFPVPTPTALATATYTPMSTPTAKPLPISLALAHTNDTWGYLDPCAA